MACIAIQGGRGDITDCAIVWAMRGGAGGARTKGLSANKSSSVLILYKSLDIQQYRVKAKALTQG